VTIDIGRIGIWTSALEGQPAAQAREAAQEIEAMGFPVLWINETTGRDPFVVATMLLSATSTLKLATGIANVYARDAMTMAACQKTLAEAFPGRFLLGLGVSSPVLVERVRKHSYGKPLSYLRAYLDDMDAAPGRPERSLAPTPSWRPSRWWSWKPIPKRPGQSVGRL
jgi:probable F420-dependent oxidoreductase